VADEPRNDGGLVLGPKDLYDANNAAHDKFDARLKRLELAVLALGLAAVGNGAGSILSKLGSL
jgi:hypothetical protein